MKTDFWMQELFQDLLRVLAIYNFYGYLWIQALSQVWRLASVNITQAVKLLMIQWVVKMGRKLKDLQTHSQFSSQVIYFVLNNRAKRDYFVVLQ